MKKLLALSIALTALCLPRIAAEEPVVGTWFHVHTALWRAQGRDPFPVKKIFRDFQKIGLTDLYFMHQRGRGGGYYHPSKVKHAKRASGMPTNRDFLKDVLGEADKYGMRVWLTWTTPAGPYPGTDYQGLNDVRLQKIYKDVIDEVARNYGKHKSLAGIHWHEVNNTTNVDNYANDVDDFRAFCKRRFGEAYPGATMPATEPKDKWWRRFLLYRNHTLTEFMRSMAEHTAKRGMKTYFCYYFPEAHRSASWRWGQDALALEKVCDYLRLSQMPGARPYLSFKGAVVDFAPGYGGQVLGRNYSYALHGKPVCYFSSFYPVYVKETRARYSAIKSWTATYGDFYTGHYGQNEASVQAFYGMKNIRDWVGLMRAWQGGRPAAKVAVAINPVPFMMLYPSAPGIEYRPKVSDLIAGLTEHLDVDAMVTGSLAMEENLKRYGLIILPEDMATGLDETSYARYLAYVRRGGKMLVINTPVVTSRADLTARKDRTRELCGVVYEGTGLPGYLRVKSRVPSIAPPAKKFWARTSKINPAGAEVLAVDANTGAPMLTRYALGRGVVVFSAVGASRDAGACFASVIRTLIASPVALENNEGMRILEATVKGNAVIVPLWGRGTARLKVDTKALGLTGESLELKDLVTGTTLGRGLSPDALRRGVPVKIKYLEQPFVAAVGPPSQLRVFTGLYPSIEVFKHVGDKAATRTLVENPEVPVMVPEGKGLRVGVYHRGYGAPTLVKVLAQAGFRAFSLPRMGVSDLRRADVVVVPQVRGNRRFFNQSAESLRKYVEAGGGVLLLHDAVGHRGHGAVFPTLGKGKVNVYADRFKVTAEHPVTAGIERGKVFRHTYFDHVVIVPGAKGRTLATDTKDRPVVVAGEVGKGRVVLDGMISGWGLKKPGDRASGDIEKAPAGAERKLLINAVRWLGEGGKSAALAPVPRDRELGFVEYAKFQWRKRTPKWHKTGHPFRLGLKKKGVAVEPVTMDIFLPAKKSERDRYKRLYIHAGAHWFTPAMYDAMEDYVRSGGLLVTNSSIFGIDTNGDYKLGREDTWMKNPGNKTLGVSGSGTAYMTKMRVEVACPLTAGLERGGWVPLAKKIVGRKARNYGAKVVVTSDRIYKGKPAGTQPMLTYRHAGKGACIYIVPHMSDEPHMKTILDNVLGKETLDWLTTQ